MPFTPTSTNSVIFLSIFILAFFPSLFATLIRLPLLPFTYYAYRSTPVVPIASCSHCHCTPQQQSKFPETTAAMSWSQKTFTLPTKSRGSYLITDVVEKEVPEIKDYKVGLLNLFIQHTSCALSLNENWDSEVRYVYPPIHPAISPPSPHVS